MITHSFVSLGAQRKAATGFAAGMTPIGTSHTVLSKDGTRIGYLSLGTGPSVLVVPGVLSTAADYAAFARALSEHFTVHTIERRGRGESGPQGDDYSIVKECEDVLAVGAETGAALIVGHSYGGLIALEVATRRAIPAPAVRASLFDSLTGSYIRDMDEDLADLDRDALMEEVRRLRAGIREHRDSFGHELCWHHPRLWGLLPEKTEPQPSVPAWPQFLRGCIQYRESLDRQLPATPRTSDEFQRRR